MGSSASEELKLLSDEEFEKFSKLFPEITSAVFGNIELRGLPQCVTTYYGKLWHYNILPGRKIRAEILILAFKFLSPQFVTNETIRMSYILGWILEILHSASTIGLGLMGKGEKGKDCWYTKVGLAAVNDMVLVENSAYILAKKYFEHQPYYSDIMNFLHTTSFQTSFGRGVELRTEDLTEYYASPKYGMTLYESVSQYRSSYNIFYVPVALAMIMSGVKKEKYFLEVKKITLRIGAYYQAQEDFLDVFGFPEHTERIGRDIANCNYKYNWPVVTAFERANDDQRKILMENCGRNDFLNIAEVKAIFEDLKIKQLYWEYEFQSRTSINAEIESSKVYPQPLFQIIMAAIIALWS